jgi:hypothetical protein
VLRDGRSFEQASHGARGYPDRPASQAELDAKFMSCAIRALGQPAAAAGALEALRRIEAVGDVRELTAQLRSPVPGGGR